MSDDRHIHFSRVEFDARLKSLRDEMAARDLDAMLLFAQESMYWLSGYDTFGYCFFQCMLVLPEGSVEEGGARLLTRSADLRQARFTSILGDVHVWKDAADADPTADLRRLLDEAGLQGKRLGVETDTHGLTAKNWRLLEARLDGWASLIDASDVVSTLRLVKSPAEIAYVRRAGELGDAAYRAALEEIRPGAEEATILAAMHNAIFTAGGDYPGNEFIIGSGPVTPGGANGALLCRYYSGRRTLSAEDQLTLEWAGAYRRYHMALMRTTPIGRATEAHLRMHGAAREALLACEEALKPGSTMGDVFAAHARTLDAAGLGHARLNACGYSLGARYTPSWMEHQMFYENAPTVMAPNMVFFLHMILMDSDTGAAMTLGRTSLVTETGAEPLSALPLELDERG